MTRRPYSLTRATFMPGVKPPQAPIDRALWFMFRGYRLLVDGAQEDDGNDAQVRVPVLRVPPTLRAPQSLGLQPTRTQYLGRLDQTHCFSAELSDGVETPPGMAFQGLRSLYGALDEDHFWIAGRAVQIVDWDRTHQFCSACGARVQSAEHERVKICPQCDQHSYPRLAPAIIVAVTRGNRLLLARSGRHPTGLYSVLAGFVEPGETLEECLMREVREEVGIEVKNIRYFGSQPWPFPHSLMIAFTCEHARGELTPDGQEIEDAGWFAADELPRVPSRISISRRLIDWFVEGRAEIG